MFLEITIGLLVICCCCLYFYISLNYNYWKNKEITFIKPLFPLGIITNQFLGKADSGTTALQHYLKYKAQGLKYVGAFVMRRPTLILLDLDLCKNVLTKDFNHFVSREFVPITHEYISKNLFSLNGHKWKEMRSKLTPTFTSGKMKNMFLLMENCAKQLQQHIIDVVLKDGEFEVKDLVARFTTDIIATCAFGLEVNSVRNENDNFFKTGQLIFVPSQWRIFKLFIFHSFPTLAKLLKLNLFDPRVSDRLTSIVKDTVKHRKEHNVTRNDFIDLLIKMNEDKSLEEHVEDNINTNHDHPEDGLTLEEMTAQAFVFFAAGFETAASTTSFCLYELAKNKDIQTRLQQEVDEVLSKYGGHISYHALQEMSYMDQVMNETLRLYASLPVLTRTCTEKYQFPESNLVIEEGVRIQIPTYAFHHDPEIYPDPDQFDPDRFSQENCKSRHPYAFIPFGEGPRACIGKRFGKLQVKIGLVAILSKYELALAPDTPSKLEINPFIVFTTPKHPFRLRISKRAT